MGFKQRTFTFDYDETTNWPGLTVVMRPAKVGEALVLDKIVEQAREGIDKAFTGDGNTRTEMLELVSTCIIRWNIEEDVLDEDTGEPTGVTVPVPVTPETVEELEIGLFLDLFMSWVVEVRGVKRPLSSPSPDGEPSLEAPTSSEPPSADQLGIDVEMETSAGRVTA
jgi:hypothetical protein